PLMERHPGEAVKNNVFGTLNIVEASDKYQVSRFVLVSTDKAVKPTNIMGATKRISELIIQAYNHQSATEFVAVRFGNVLGSNGSVIPLFLKQIEKGGPLTVTHREVTRFFMTISEAATLVIQAGIMAAGGEIFILDMGKPVRIYDLAESLIRMIGMEPHRDIQIEITGLRPGEKLYEELLLDGEVRMTPHPKLFVAGSSNVDFEELKTRLEELNHLQEEHEIKEKIRDIVPEYNYSNSYDNDTD
ncbi:MAG: polysaccharide biosynthesis protein, partial [Clostridia bacterium]